MFFVTGAETEHTDSATAGNDTAVEMNDSKIQLDLSLGASTPRWVLFVHLSATSFSWRLLRPILVNEVWLSCGSENADDVSLHAVIRQT